MIVDAKIYLVLLKAELALEGAALRLGQGHGLLAALEAVAMGNDAIQQQLWEDGDGADYSQNDESARKCV